MASTPKPQGTAHAYPSISLPRALHDDAPFASYAALSHLPEHPATATASRDAWSRIVDAVRLHHPPSAELSFHTMALWYGDPAFSLSRIGGFVVVDLADAPRHVTVIALPGARTSQPVVAQLAALLRTYDVRLMSEPTAEALVPAAAMAGTSLAADRDMADYILSMDALASLDGPEFSAKRREVRRLQRKYGERLELRQGDLNEPWAQAHLAAATRRWIDRKFSSPAGISAAVRREWRGILRWADEPSAAELRLFGVLLDGEPVAASVVTSMWNGTWMGLVMKTDPTIAGLTPYLRQQVARAGVRELGAGTEFNVQQDDGLPGLRKAKTSYRPVRLVPKYSVVRTGQAVLEAA